MGNCRERDSLASWNRNDPSTGVWERERKGKERERKREGKLLRRLWTGRCSNFKGPIPIFNLLRGQGGGGQSQLSLQPSAGSLPVPGLVPRYSRSSRRILFLGPLPSLPPPYPSTTRDFPSKNLSHHESYGRGSIRGIHPTSSWSNEFHPRARRVEMEKEKGGEGGLYRSKYRPTTIPRSDGW